MKKVLFSALSCAAMFASCSDNLETIESVAPGTNDLALRPVVSSEISVGEMTRAAAGQTYVKPSAGDKMGAAIIDVPTYNTSADWTTKANFAARYNLVDYISSNYPYEFSGSAWKTEAELVEGNYLFYTPFNLKNGIRKPLTTQVPAVQNAKESLKTFGENEDGNISWLGYVALDATKSLRPAVTMQEVYAYPEITIVNDFDGYLFNAPAGTPTFLKKYQGTITVKQVSFGLANLEDMTDGTNAPNATYVVGGTILNKAYGTPSEDIKARLANWAKNDYLYSEDQAKYGTNYVVANNASYEVQKTGDAARKNFITTVNVNEELASGKSTTFQIVMPADKFEKKLYAVVTVEIEGKEYQIVQATTNCVANLDGTLKNPTYTGATQILHSHQFAVTDATTGTTGVTLIRGQRYPREEFNFKPGTNDPKDLKAGKGKLMTITLKGSKHVAAGDVTGQVALDSKLAAASTAGMLTQNSEILAKAYVNNLALTEKGAFPCTGSEFVINPNNEIKINAELIEGLATQLAAGSLKFINSYPVASDVVVKNVSGNDITFAVAANPSVEYVINMPQVAATTSITANGTYFADGTVPTITGVNSGDVDNPLTDVTIVVTGAVTLNIPAADAKFINTISVAGTSAAALTLPVNLENSSLNIYNYNTLTLSAKTNSNIINAKGATFNNNGSTLTGVVNNGKIIASATSNTKIASGNGEVDNDLLGNVTVLGGDQKVSYTLGALNAQNTAVTADKGINVIKVTTITTADATVITKPLKNCDVKTIEVSGNITTTFANADLSSILLDVKNSINWVGAATGTQITNCKLNIGVNNVTLENIDAVGSVDKTTGDVKTPAGNFASWTNK